MARGQKHVDWGNLIISGFIFHPFILLSVHLILCSIQSHSFSDHSPWREKGKVQGTEKCFKMAEQKSPHIVQCTGGPIPELTTMNLQYTAVQQVDDNLYQVWLMYWKEGWMETLASSWFFLLLFFYCRVHLFFISSQTFHNQLFIFPSRRMGWLGTED